jgi:hypothetical protein
MLQHVLLGMTWDICAHLPVPSIINRPTSLSNLCLWHLMHCLVACCASFCLCPLDFLQQGRLRDLGKFWPYNKLMPVVFGPDAVDELHRCVMGGLATQGRTCTHQLHMRCKNMAVPDLHQQKPWPVPALCRYHQQLAEVGIEGAEPPHPRVAQLTPFQQLLLVRCMQPRAFLSAATVGGVHWHWIPSSCTANAYAVNFYTCAFCYLV